MMSFVQLSKKYSFCSVYIILSLDYISGNDNSKFKQKAALAHERGEEHKCERTEDGNGCILLLRLYYRMVTKCFSGYKKGSEHNASPPTNVQTALNSKLNVPVQKTLISLRLKHYRKKNSSSENKLK